MTTPPLQPGRAGDPGDDLPDLGTRAPDGPGAGGGALDRRGAERRGGERRRLERRGAAPEDE